MKGTDLFPVILHRGHTLTHPVDLALDAGRNNVQLLQPLSSHPRHTSPCCASSLPRGASVNRHKADAGLRRRLISAIGNTLKEGWEGKAPTAVMRGIALLDLSSTTGRKGSLSLREARVLPSSVVLLYLFAYESKTSVLRSYGGADLEVREALRKDAMLPTASWKVFAVATTPLGYRYLARNPPALLASKRNLRLSMAVQPEALSQTSSHPL